MKKHIKRLKLLALALLVGAVPLLPSEIAHADPLGQMTSFPLADTKPIALAEDANGNIWTNGRKYDPYTWKTTYYAYKVDRSNGSYTTYNAYGNDTMVIGSDSNLWATSSHVTKTDTTTGARSYYVDTHPDAYPYWGLTVGPDDNLWFGMNGTKNVNGQTMQVDNIGRINTAGVFQSYFDVDVLVGSLVGDKTNNVVWYGASSRTGGSGVIGSFTPSGTKTQYTLPIPNSPGELTLGPDGNIWFPVAGNKVGKMTPTGEFTFYTFTDSPGNFQYAAWGKDGNLWATVNNKNKVARITPSGTATYYTLPGDEMASDIIGGSDGSMWVVTRNSHKLIKIGTDYTDNDEDGLQYTQEIAQGTTDNNPDFDNDGLTDYVESIDYTSRNAVFCSSGATYCEYPDPISKDIYIENDWMDKPDINGSGYSMQLNSAQVSALKTSFLDKNIKVHIDTGQLGGGNEVSYTSLINYQPTPGIIDFYDYKNGGDGGITPQFAANRKGIYHYLITGQKYTEDEGSTGASYMGDDDFFVSYGLIKENFSSQYISLNTAIAGTVMHELGHGLCLSGYNNGNPTYPGQPASCRYAGVDAFAGNTYGSVMNYDKQLLQVDYSSGINGSPDDHNDWGAIRLMDFTVSSAGDAVSGKSLYNPTLKNQKAKRNDKNTKLMIGPNVNKLKNAALQR